MINDSFYLYDHHMDARNICSHDHYFMYSLFDNFHENIEVLGFLDNDSDLPAGISLYKKKNLIRRLIRNDEGYIISDYGIKSPFELSHIAKFLPEFTEGSILDYLEEYPDLTDVPSENQPGFLVADIVDFYLKEFTGRELYYFDFYIPDLSGAKRKKQINLIGENYLRLRR